MVMRKKINPYEKVFGREIPDWVMERIVSEAHVLLRDLREKYLKVKAIAAPMPMFRKHKIRVVYNRNAKWYQDLYADLGVKRDRITRSVNRVANGTPINRSSYDYMFIEMIKERLVEGYTDENIEIPPDNYVRAFLGLRPIDMYEEKEPPKVEVIHYVEQF